MRPAALLLAALALAACAEDPNAPPNAPRVGLGVGFGPSGVTVAPRVTTQVGDASVGVSPGGASVGTSIGGVGLGVGL